MVWQTCIAPGIIFILDREGDGSEFIYAPQKGTQPTPYLPTYTYPCFSMDKGRVLRRIRNTYLPLFGHAVGRYLPRICVGPSMFLSKMTNSTAWTRHCIGAHFTSYVRFGQGRIKGWKTLQYKTVEEITESNPINATPLVELRHVFLSCCFTVPCKWWWWWWWIERIRWTVNFNWSIQLVCNLHAE